MYAIEGEPRKPLLRRWLKGHGYTPNEIAVALAWYSATLADGRQPPDAEVAGQADEAHANLVAQCAGDPTPPVTVIQHQHRHQMPVSWKVAVMAAAGSSYELAGHSYTGEDRGLAQIQSPW